ncbi:MAG TPA: ABC transporter permease subunit [Oscillospiraceae bacterium]|nr:ABC transporter permease subunit [Oscillospiraceae bacterium]HPS35263.1 ABC transporter permease subunit [Oscillospiraceae bacterium]
MLWQIFGGVTFIAVWQIIATLLNNSYILPRPAAVLSALAGLFAGNNASILSATLGRWLLGLAPAILFGMLLGSLSAAYARFGAFMAPLFTVIKSIPIVAVILLALVWLKAPYVPSFAVFLAAFPSVCENSAAGVRGIDRRLTEMGKVYRFSLSKRLFGIYLPSIASYVVAAIKTAAGIGLKAVVVTELVVQPVHSVGAQMQTARVTLSTDILLAWTVLVILMGYLLDRLLGLVEKQLRNRY